MTIIEPNGRPHVACAKCKNIVVWPQSLSLQHKAMLADQCRSSRMECAKLAISKFGFDLSEAKALSLHITGERGKCHRCGASVVGEICVCSNCHSANLDW